MTTLTGPERPAASGAADSVVVFLHGYGADGNDLIGLAEPLAPHLPNTRFLAPNAPERCPGNPMGYPVVSDPLARRHRPRPRRAPPRRRPSRLLDGWLDDLAATDPAGAHVLFGFSQGTMMALQVGLRRKAALAGIVGFSGRLLDPETLAAEIAARPPVLLVHGDQDPMVPFASLGRGRRRR